MSFEDRVGGIGEDVLGKVDYSRDAEIKLLKMLYQRQSLFRRFIFSELEYCFVFIRQAQCFVHCI